MQKSQDARRAQATRLLTRTNWNYCSQPYPNRDCTVEHNNTIDGEERHRLTMTMYDRLYSVHCTCTVTLGHNYLHFHFFEHPTHQKVGSFVIHSEFTYSLLSCRSGCPAHCTIVNICNTSERESNKSSRIRFRVNQ